MQLKHIIATAALTISGIACLYYGETKLAGVCFGAIAAYALKNGVNRK